MKSVTFLRNTWKKWENKSLDASRNPLEASSPKEPQRPPPPLSSPVKSRPLTVTVRHLPADISNVSLVEGTWQISGNSPSSSPICDQVPVSRHSRTHARNASGNHDMHTTYYGNDMKDTQDTFRPSLPTLPKPFLHRSPKNPSASLPPTSLSSSAQWSPIRSKKEDTDSSACAVSTNFRQPTSSLSPYPPALPTTQLLPSIDFSFEKARKKQESLLASKCNHPSPGKRDIQCSGRCTLEDAQRSMESTRISFTPLNEDPKTAQSVLNLSHDARQSRSLYYTKGSGSTPHLPYRERVHSTTSTTHSESSAYSVDSSETEHFPLSLFPLPPPLIVRKKVPAPLVLRTPTSTDSTQSSRDSTPVGTPTTPRFQCNSPSQTSIASPTKKICLGRPMASFSPPPFSPPNSPLPQLPVDGARRTGQNDIRPLRTSQSTASFRSTLPFPPKHRLTSSEPISDQSSSLPIRRPAKPQTVTERPLNIQMYMDQLDSKERPTTPSSNENHVQWGYAF